MLWMLERGGTLPIVKSRCRLCSCALEKKRRVYCTDEHRDLYRMATNTSFLRFKVFERDKGVCAACELDCDALEVRIYGYSSNVKRPFRVAKSQLMLPPAQREMRVQVLRDNGWVLKSTHPKTLWAADHIEPLIDGGAFTLDNVQTLCLPCHQEKTSDEATWRAKRKKVLGVRTLETVRRFKKMGL